VTDDTFTFAEWNTELNGWWWWHAKPINSHATGPRSDIAGAASSKGLLCAPAIPYPVEAQ